MANSASKVDSKPTWRFNVMRGCLSLLIASVITATSYITAWHELRGNTKFVQDQHATLNAMHRLTAYLEEHSRKTEAYPTTLKELSLSDDDPDLRVAASGNPTDAWGHDYQFRVTEKTFELSSLGRDGKPGGVGLDADLDHRQSPYDSTEEMRLTFQQFATDIDTSRIKRGCLILGGISSVVIFSLLGDYSRRTSSLQLALSIAITIAGSIVMAMFMSALHIPNHH